MRYNQEAYFQKYGSSVMWQYAPKSNTIVVVLTLLVVGTVISWFVQKQHWQNIADKLIKAAVEDLPIGRGGSPESRDIRERALKILEERESTNGTTNEDITASKKKKKAKLTVSEKRKQQEDALRPIIVELVDEFEDFGAGYHKPTWRALLIVKVVKFPVVFVQGSLWNAKYIIRRLQKKEQNEEEREILTRRAVGEINWHSCNEEERKEMIMKDLWIPDNMVDWEEEQEVKLLSNADKKRYKQWKKNKAKGKEE